MAEKGLTYKDVSAVTSVTRIATVQKRKVSKAEAMLLARQERLRSNRQQEAESTAADVLARKQKISATTAGSYGKKLARSRMFKQEEQQLMEVFQGMSGLLVGALSSMESDECPELENELTASLEKLKGIEARQNQAMTA